LVDKSAFFRRFAYLSLAESLRSESSLGLRYENILPPVVAPPFYFSHAKCRSIFEQGQHRWER